MNWLEHLLGARRISQQAWKPKSDVYLGCHYFVSIFWIKAFRLQCWVHDG